MQHAGVRFLKADGSLGPLKIALADAITCASLAKTS